MKGITLFLVLIALLGGVATAADAQIRGDYLEVRTANVFVGPCVANGEVNLVGKEAILAWRVREGSWEDTAVQGLSVVAVVRADATLGDPFGGETEPALFLFPIRSYCRGFPGNPRHSGLQDRLL